MCDRHDAVDYFQDQPSDAEICPGTSREEMRAVLRQLPPLGQNALATAEYYRVQLGRDPNSAFGLLESLKLQANTLQAMVTRLRLYDDRLHEGSGSYERIVLTST